MAECLTWDPRAAGPCLNGVTALCPLARHINPSLVLVQPRKSRPCITERLLMGCKESNQRKTTIQNRCLRTDSSKSNGGGGGGGKYIILYRSNPHLRFENNVEQNVESCHLLQTIVQALWVNIILCLDESFQDYSWPGLVAQSVASPTADPGVASWIPAQSHTFVEIDHEIISTVILLIQLIQKGLLSVTGESICRKYWLTT